MAQQFSKVEDAIEAIRRGEVVIVVDAEDRENEGDFVCAADKATPEAINFILHGRGQLCVSVLPDVCGRLQLNPLCAENTASRSTAFMTPAGVLCEILDQRGDRASREQLVHLAHEQKLRIVSIEQLIDYAGRTENLVSRAAEANLPTKYGPFKINSRSGTDPRADQPPQRPLPGGQSR